MRGCKITRSQLDRIWELAKEGFPPNSHILITTKRLGGGIPSDITGESIDETLEAVRRSTLPGDPDYLDNLRLHITTLFVEPTTRTVLIKIEPSALEVLVEGGDPGWVRGRIGGLKDHFADTRTKWIIGRGNARFIFWTLGNALGGVSFVAVSTSGAVGRNVVVVVLLEIAWLAGLGGAGFLLGAWMDRRAKTELRLLPVTRVRTVDWVNVALLIATILVLVVGVIGAVVAHRDATHPHSSGLSYTSQGSVQRR
jgi:hypothetical protein